MSQIKVSITKTMLGKLKVPTYRAVPEATELLTSSNENQVATITAAADTEGDVWCVTVYGDEWVFVKFGEDPVITDGDDAHYLLPPGGPYDFLAESGHEMAYRNAT